MSVQAVQSGRAKVTKDGRIQIPADMRHALHISSGDTITLEACGGTIVVRKIDDVLADIRGVLAPYLNPDESLTDELIAERRSEAANG